MTLSYLLFSFRFLFVVVVVDVKMKTSKTWENSLHMKSLQLDCGFQSLISFSWCYWQLSVRSLIWTVVTHLPDDQGPRFPPLHNSSSFGFCSFPELCEDYPMPQPIFHSLLFALNSVRTENLSLSKISLPLDIWVTTTVLAAFIRTNSLSFSLTLMKYRFCEMQEISPMFFSSELSYISLLLL